MQFIGTPRSILLYLLFQYLGIQRIVLIKLCCLAKVHAQNLKCGLYFWSFIPEEIYLNLLKINDTYEIQFSIGIQTQVETKLGNDIFFLRYFSQYFRQSMCICMHVCSITVEN